MFCNCAVTQSVLIESKHPKAQKRFRESTPWCGVIDVNNEEEEDVTSGIQTSCDRIRSPENQPENLDISCMEVFFAMTGDKFWDCKREAGFNLFKAVGESVSSNLKLSLYIMASDESI